ncbi:NUDIX hydrolase [Cronobacter dublinensis subsp. dublinensis]|nr:NUDIX hydrolase [Cronobacter dublinensis subsp. dublinensis]EGT5670255.1 NUDIX hydrolase [Cronobacter dublinensis subsp. dublinensis]EGT5674514.1 NUDIX hydrolase [Cronobacter dublinensis subsp. dublinensis]EGT5678499.1 NUDIX hydrolase [Cronobacter dublinensis subsp. dublinensis]EGT5687174.1 NUDIX hydrolase [Cronobacter dublinensis subsp. dublinensis]
MSKLILVAGPWRSGTNGDETLMRQNLARLEQAALALFERGHVPVIGEWLALPLAGAAGSGKPGDAISERFLYPVAHRLVAKCDAVLRLPGASGGADRDVEIAREHGLTIYFSLEDVPQA